MIVTQEKALVKAQEQLQAMCNFIRQATGQRLRLDQVERDLLKLALELCLMLLEEFVAKAGDGDIGTTIEQSEHVLCRLEKPRTRRYVSVFGELEITRFVYSRREGQKVERSPLDERLGVPAGDFSYVLQDWLQRFCIKESFAEAGNSLQMLLGLTVPVRSAEHMNRQMAKHAEAFRLSQSPPAPEEEAEILVVTADAKGVPMRRPLEERVRRSKRRGKGEKANKKQMACVGAVYSIRPYRRTAEDVVGHLREDRHENRPPPQNKRIWAEMTRAFEGESFNGKTLLFAQMAIELHERDPDRHKTTVCLMDGEAALWESQREWISRAVGVLDLFHVLERLWDVAHCAHPEKSPEAEKYVSQQLRLLLEGKVGYVIGNMQRLVARHKLKGEQLKTVLSAIGYYANNRQHMRYDEYLAAGYPIASGVVEGACRHLVKDRLEQTGMRWTVDGAQSMLHLRAIYLNGHWNDFVEYRIKTEQETLYAQAA